jgi:flagellar hook assembly protein FlgD
MSARHIPNPSPGSALLSIELAAASCLEIQVYDASGRYVADISGGSFTAGSHELSWDGRDGDGRDLPAGIYFVSVKAEQDSEVLKVILAR